MKKSIFTKAQQKAIDKVCKDYDFEDEEELRFFIKEEYGDEFEDIWFDSDREDDCYESLSDLIKYI